jgi:hypothetical protein
LAIHVDVATTDLTSTVGAGPATHVRLNASIVLASMRAYGALGCAASQSKS